MSEPFIGVTCDIELPRHDPADYHLTVSHRYVDAIKAAGGYPVLLPVARRIRTIDRYLRGVDGVVIAGGDDVDPSLYGEQIKAGTRQVFPPRLTFERKLFARTRAMGLPILGICYGMQLINVLEGGTLFQDIRRDAKSKFRHRNIFHKVRIEPGSTLARILRGRWARVCSDHHQAVCRVAPGFRPVAFAPDGIVEAIECDDHKVLAVQWHPEHTPASVFTRRLMRAFVRMALR